MSWEQLGIEVRERRAELKLTQVQLASEAGFSVDWMRIIESNRDNRKLGLRVRRGLERALGWEPGSVEAIVEGGSPTLIDKAENAAAHDAPSAQVMLAYAGKVLDLSRTLLSVVDDMPAEGRQTVIAQLGQSAVEAEEFIVRALPWLDTTERNRAVSLLLELRQIPGRPDLEE